MTKFIGLPILICLLAFSCTNPKPSSGQFPIPQETNDLKLLSNLVQKVEFIPLSGELSLLPQEADKLAFMDQLIVLGDFTYSNSLFAIDVESGNPIQIPLQKGDGPMEARNISDFWVESNLIYVLDGLGKKIFPMSFKNGVFELEEPIRLDLPLRKFARTKTGFVGLSGGGQDHALVFLDAQGKIISSHFPISIEFLMNPLNPFHQVVEGEERKVILHTQFSPVLYRLDKGEIEEYGKFFYAGASIKSPIKTDYVMDQDGFNQYRSSLKDQPSFFTLFETTQDQFLLFHMIKDVPRMALVDGVVGLSLRLDNLINDLSFDQPFPKVTGVNEDKFVALISKDQINKSTSGYQESELFKVIQTNPEAQLFLLQFMLELKQE
jgi:hypothetical protein